MVEAELEGEIGAVFGARLWSEVGFPVSGDAVAALTSAEAAAILGALNPGEVRYRIRFAGGGHRRAAVRAIATAVAAARPELVNDPTRSDWEAVIGDGVVELRPRGLADPRFAYRRADVPAASHPTLAAALARAAFLAAEAPADEVIWDPFCGSGVELVERARLGRFRRLVGSDTSAAAIEAARANLSAAAVTAELLVADALHHRVDGLTTIVTNPPMGRRVARGDSAALLDRFVARAGELLPAGGRMVWIAPSPRRIAAALAAAGFAVRSRATVDMGGFPGELQVLERRRPG